MADIPLTKKEYYTLRELFGIINSFEKCAQDLKARCQSIDGGWRDLRLIQSKSESLLKKILKTVPLNKLNSMNAELPFITCEVKVTRDYTGRMKNEGWSYVPDAELSRVVARLIGERCLLCDKSGKEHKRCNLYKDICALYPWEMPPRADRCPFAGMSAGIEEDLYE